MSLVNPSRFTIRADSLIPDQRHIPTSFLRKANCLEQYGLKFRQCGIFHSYAEFLHGGLLEGDPEVDAYTPQPFLLYINGRRYVPDCYLVKGGKRIVCELKPRGEFDPGKQRALEAFFAFHAMTFVVLSNEDMLARQVEALNWWHIVRTLYAGRDINTDPEEQTLWHTFFSHPVQPLGSILDPSDRLGNVRQELALFRLLFRHRLTADLTLKRLHLDTEITQCK